MTEQAIQQRHKQVDMIFVKTQEFIDNIIGDTNDTIAHQNYMCRLLEACFWAHQGVGLLANDEVNPQQENEDVGRTSEQEHESDSETNEAGSGTGKTIAFPEGGSEGQAEVVPEGQSSGQGQEVGEPAHV